MISNYDYYRDKPEIKPAIDCLDILTELCGIVSVDNAMRVMNEHFDPKATVEQIYDLIGHRDCFGQDFGTWTHQGIDYFTHGSLTAASCNISEFYRAKHQLYTYDEESGEYIGDYGPANYERAEAKRLKYLEHLAAVHDGTEPPADLSEYLDKGVEDALFERRVSKQLHKVARAKRRDKMSSFIAEQAIRQNIRHIIGCDGTSDIWVPLLRDNVIAHTSLPFREKLDISEIEQLTLEMFLTFPKWENNGWPDERCVNRGRRFVHFPDRATRAARTLGK